MSRTSDVDRLRAAIGAVLGRRVPATEWYSKTAKDLEDYVRRRDVEDRPPSGENVRPDQVVGMWTPAVMGIKSHLIKSARYYGTGCIGMSLCGRDDFPMAHEYLTTEPPANACKMCLRKDEQRRAGG